MSIKIGLFGYGNIAKAAESGILQNSDMELVAVFTRRNPSDVKTVSGVPVHKKQDVLSFTDKIDVMLMCGGSATDLPKESPDMAKYFNIVDSFDTHTKVLEHFNNVDKSAKEGKKVSIISAGWDPGVFSLNRLFSEAFLPNGKGYTFWGKGVSQGHSDAVRRIDGVKQAVQYTNPSKDALKEVREGILPVFSPCEMHTRECFVVLKDGANKGLVESAIKNMPNYFKDYNTTVHFITDEEFNKNHTAMPHGGTVIRSGFTGIDNENKQIIEYSIKLNSNPEFTANILLCYARAAYRLYNAGDSGCKTVFDIAPYLLFSGTKKDIMERLI
ncbi:MAG: diaminopimelate dehydrogenase [Clostridiales bacterium]|jgi:diaminopimelate dehydrogenase|nr:diaminopimelate dehydrogenase [Clostridiales bacterium]